MKSNASAKLPDSLFHRNLRKEAEYGIKNISLYAYNDFEDSLTVHGQVFAEKSIKKSFCLFMTLYDSDGDIIDTSESYSYGSGLVTSMIRPEAFFDGFPFRFSFSRINWDEVSRIELAPADTY